jgi:hypothetical protein
MKTHALLPAALAAALLAACGGGGGDAPAPAPKPSAITVTTAADEATQAWNQATTVKVLANDSASRGALKLTAVGAAANGTAKAVGNDVEYTPKADFVGTDSFTYTAQAEDGVTATGTVTVKVNAALTLKGVVTDGPIANAVVTAKVGTQSFTTTADAQGAYSLTVQTGTPTDAVSLAATGVGTQANVKLNAVLGDLASLYRQANQGVLAGTGITHYSTALAALLTEANANQAPTTVAQVASLGRSLSTDRLVDLATAIKLVVDKGVALPSGVADTAALVQDPGSSAALKAFLAQQQASNATVLAATRDEVLAADGVPGQAFAPTAATQRLYYITQLGTLGAAQVNFQPDGTGRLTMPDFSVTGRWSFDAAKGDVVFTLDTPRSLTGFLNDAGQQYQIRSDTDVYRFKQLAGDTASGSALMQVRSTTEILDGPRKGEKQTTWSNALWRFTTPAQMPAFKAAEFSAGMKFGGMTPLGDYGQPANTRSGADILELTGATTARLLRTGETLSWQVAADGALVISRGDLESRHHDLGLPDDFGLVKWLAVTTTRAGVPVSAEVVPAVSLDGNTFGSVFRNNLLGKRWAAQLNRTGSGLDYTFQDTGRGQRISVNLATGAETAQNTRWTSPAATGSLVINLLNAAGTVTQTREWILLNSNGTGSCFSVLEQLRPVGSSASPWRLNVLADTSGTCSSGITPAALGTLVAGNGERFALRVTLTLDAAGLVSGGSYDFHTTKGTLTPCTATPANTGPTGTCFGTDNTISRSSQSGAIPRNGTSSAVTLSVGPDSYGYTFTGTLLGKVWTGNFTKVATATAPNTDAGTFSVEVSLP